MTQETISKRDIDEWLENREYQHDEDAFQNWFKKQNQTIGEAMARACWRHWEQVYNLHTDFYNLTVRERDFERRRNEKLQAQNDRLSAFIRENIKKP